jgi:exopolysaccharide biosynthesis polyprenyl glycosylphosphotransferase
MSTADQRLTFDTEMADFAAAEADAPELHAEVFAETGTKRRSASAQAQLRKAVALCAATGDFLAAVAGVCAAGMVEHALGGWAGQQAMHGAMQRAIQEPGRAATALTLLAGLLVVLLLRNDRSYFEGGSLLQIRETERALRSSTLTLLMLAPIGFLLGVRVHVGVLLAAFLAMPLFLILEKQVLAGAIRALHSRGWGVERVVVCGSAGAARRIVSALLDSPQLGMRPVAVIDDGAVAQIGPQMGPRMGWMPALGYRGRNAIPLRHGPVTPMLLKSCGCDVLVIAGENASAKQTVGLARAAKQMGMRLAYLANSAADEWQVCDTFHIDGLMLTAVADPALPTRYALAKRAMDLAVTFVLLVLLAPLLLAIAILVRLDSQGPALFVQKRVGLHGRIFKIFKFRTMHTGVAKYDVSPATADDCRITRVGRMLRRTSLDELPQLLNVLLGDMSLVGPRPEMPFLVAMHPGQHRPRLQATPGITGLWQLSADREFQIHENLHYDLYYIRNRTFFLDAAILIHTIFFAMHGV